MAPVATNSATHSETLQHYVWKLVIIYTFTHAARATATATAVITHVSLKS